ncbi:MAG: SDR family NAD(P)-dependent oxidoreductase [Pseudomonadota bacterium]
MKNALIIGASGGIGSALSKVLSDGDVAVTGLSRSVDGLDVTDEASVAAALDPISNEYDLILVATGGLEISDVRPEKSLKDLSAEAMLAQFKLNTMGPALVLKHAQRLLPKDRRAVFAALSARVGSIGDNQLGGWYSYRTAKAALNQMLHGASIELGRSHKQAICVALHPGTVATSLTRKYVGKHPAVAPEEAAQNLIRVINGLTVEDTGGFFDWQGKRIPW